jgi:hypothetical protein
LNFYLLEEPVEEELDLFVLELLLVELLEELGELLLA